MTAIYRSYIGLLAQELVSALQTSKHLYSQVFTQKEAHCNVEVIGAPSEPLSILMKLGTDIEV